jgi:glycosyltransferase involved in cell wall biosynthesis
MAACVVVHLTASTFYGGPERQMLGLAENLAADYQTAFLSFAEGGRCQAFLDETRQRGFTAAALHHDTPHFAAMIRELAARLRKLDAKVLCCHGYKATLLGRLAARRLGVPVVAVSRGWTGESLRVRLYEALERLGLRWMDRVVCVSEGQARKVRRVGVRAPRALVIPNAIQAERFAPPALCQRQRLQELFGAPRTRIVGAAGRLSPEKGFDVLVDAAAQLLHDDPGLGFVLFGDGTLREALTRHIMAAGISSNFVLTGFRRDLDGLLPSLDLLVLPSFTEGMPNVAKRRPGGVRRRRACCGHDSGRHARGGRGRRERLPGGAGRCPCTGPTYPRCARVGGATPQVGAAGTGAGAARFYVRSPGGSLSTTVRGTGSAAAAPVGIKNVRYFYGFCDHQRTTR